MCQVFDQKKLPHANEGYRSKVSSSQQAESFLEEFRSNLIVCKVSIEVQE